VNDELSATDHDGLIWCARGSAVGEHVKGASVLIGVEITRDFPSMVAESVGKFRISSVVAAR
jgi:hypothetical protein